MFCKVGMEGWRGCRIMLELIINKDKVMLWIEGPSFVYLNDKINLLTLGLWSMGVLMSLNSVLEKEWFSYIDQGINFVLQQQHVVRQWSILDMVGALIIRHSWNYLAIYLWVFGKDHVFVIIHLQQSCLEMEGRVRHGRPKPLAV